MLPTLAFVLVTGFTLNNGAISTIVVPGLADENECHKLALKLNTPKHGCFEYRMAVPHIDLYAAECSPSAPQEGPVRLQAALRTLAPFKAARVIARRLAGGISTRLCWPIDVKVRTSNPLSDWC